MATENKCSGLKVLDPVEGLVDYINDIKPYHTKIVEVLVEYVYGEALDVTIDDNLHTEIDLFRPEVDGINYTCDYGYSLLPYGAPGNGWPIVPPNQGLSEIEYNTHPAFNQSAGSFTVPGDRSKDIRPGDKVQIVTWIEDYEERLIQSVVGSPLVAFVIAGDWTSWFVGGFKFEVQHSVENNGTYTVAPGGSTFSSGVTTIPVTETIPSYTSPLGRIFYTLPDTSGAFVPGGSPAESFFTVTQSVYNPGTIDSWPGYPDPAQYYLGDEPHTVIMLQGGFGTLPTLGPNQTYVAFVRLAPVEIERAYAYSNATTNYDSSTLVLSQEPDEGYLRRDVQGVVLSTLDGYGAAIPDTGKIIVGGNLLKSNIFEGDQVAVYESTGNNGVFTISSLSYDGVYDQTSIGVVERIRDLTPDGEIRIDVPSNVFVVDGDHRQRFHQGYVFDVAGGSFAGEYTTLSSDYVKGKTRIRTTRDILNESVGFTIIGTATGFIIRGDKTSKFTTGSQANVTGSPTNDGAYVVVSSQYDSAENQTEVLVCSVCTGSPQEEQVDAESGGVLIPVQMGVIKEETYGFGEHSDFCATVPETMVRVKFHERLTFDGLGLDLYDDLIVYNMENSDSAGYELPLITNIASTPPTIPEATVPPLTPQVNDYWFNTALSSTSYSTSPRSLHRFTGATWDPVTTVYWLDFDTKLLYYRTKTSTVDTGWVLAFAEPPGFSDIQPAIGQTVLTGMETFVAEDAQTQFTFNVYTFPVAGVADGTLLGTEDYFVIDGDVKASVNGMHLAVGSRNLTVTNSSTNDGVYTISNVVYIAADDQSRIYVEENIPTTISDGDLSIGPLTVITSGSPLDTTLIRVTVNGVPANITLDSPTQFTVLSPEVNEGDTVIAKAYDTSREETNANVVQYGAAPHRVFHDGVELSHSDRAYTLYGGNYVHRMIPENRLEVYQFGTGGSLLGIQQPTTISIVDVDDENGTILIEGDWTWLFQPQRVFSVRYSENNLNDFEVGQFGSPAVGSTFDGTHTTIYVNRPDVYESPEQPMQWFYNPGIAVVNIDNFSDTIFVSGDVTTSFAVGSQIQITNSMTGNNGLWTVSNVTYYPPAGSPTSLPLTGIEVVEDLPDPDSSGNARVHTPIIQNYSRDLGVILGAVYDPVVDHSDSDDQIKTYVVPTTTPYLDANGVTYTWYGPLRIELAIAFRNNLRTSVLDGIGASNELMQVPDRYEIISTDRTTNTIRIHYDDPLTGLPVDLTDSFTPGTVFRIAGSQGPLEEQTNNYQYVVRSATWDSTPIYGSPYTWTGSGDTVIEVDTDFDNIPPYVELDVISATNVGGSPANLTQLEVSGNLSNIVKSYNLDTGNAVIRFDQPIIDIWGPRNATTITNVEYTATTTIFTLDTDIADEAFTGSLGFVTETFVGGIYYDETNASTGSPSTGWANGYIIRDSFRIDSAPEVVAAATFAEQLDFGWDTTYRWDIRDVRVGGSPFVSEIDVSGDVTSVLYALTPAGSPDDINDIISIVNSAGGVNDGQYEVAYFSYNAGSKTTTIGLANPPLAAPTPGSPPGVHGTLVIENIDITNWFQYLIREAKPNVGGSPPVYENAFIVQGNALRDVQAGQRIRVVGTTNDGVYTVLSVVFDTSTTTTKITVDETILNNENGGWIESYMDYGIELILEDTIGVNITENADAALILTAGSFVDSFDYNYFDVGSYDENLATVLHLYGNTFKA